MPIKMQTAIVDFDKDEESSQEVAERINYRLNKFSKEYPEFSYRIEEYTDKLIVKTIMLGENVN